MMFEPLLHASPQIQLHVVAAVLAIALGPFTLFRKRRARIHKTLGYIWVCAMAVTAITSLFIFELRLFGPFSPIHLLSLFTIGALFSGVRFAIQGKIPAHRKTMQSLYFWALGIAGLFTFTPGRALNKVFFAGYETEGFLAFLALSGLLIALYFWRRASRPV